MGLKRKREEGENLMPVKKRKKEEIKSDDLAEVSPQTSEKSTPSTAERSGSKNKSEPNQNLNRNDSPRKKRKMSGGVFKAPEKRKRKYKTPRSGKTEIGSPNASQKPEKSINSQIQTPMLLDLSPVTAFTPSKTPSDKNLLSQFFTPTEKDVCFDPDKTFEDSPMPSDPSKQTSQREPLTFDDSFCDNKTETSEKAPSAAINLYTPRIFQKLDDETDSPPNISIASTKYSKKESETISAEKEKAELNAAIASTKKTSESINLENFSSQIQENLLEAIQEQSSNEGKQTSPGPASPQMKSDNLPFEAQFTAAATGKPEPQNSQIDIDEFSSQVQANLLEVIHSDLTWDEPSKEDSLELPESPKAANLKNYNLNERLRAFLKGKKEEDANPAEVLDEQTHTVQEEKKSENVKTGEEKDAKASEKVKPKKRRTRTGRKKKYLVLTQATQDVPGASEEINEMESLK